jgi:hypothetical protein
MKLLVLLSIVLLSACTARPYVPFVLPPASPVASKGASSLIIFTPDSAEVAYAHALDGLSRAGYQTTVRKHSLGGKPTTFSTRPKTVQHVAGLALQVVIDPLTKENVLGLTGRPAPLDALGRPLLQGCVVTFMAKYVPVDSVGQEEHDSRKWHWIHYGLPQTNLPTQAFWEDMRDAAIKCYPGARIGYE